MFNILTSFKSINIVIRFKSLIIISNFQIQYFYLVFLFEIMNKISYEYHFNEVFLNIFFIKQHYILQLNQRTLKLLKFYYQIKELILTNQ